jgi:HEAT repeat protein
MRKLKCANLGIVALTLFLLSSFSIFASQSRVQTTQRPASPALDKILKKLASYEYGQEESVLWKLRDHVHANKNSPEARRVCEEQLVAFLDSKASLAAKMTVCRHLRLIGSEKSVPILQKMLLDEETTDMARYALEKIPDPAADDALLEAMASAQGTIKTGIIASFGQRKSKEAVTGLEKLLQGSNPEFTMAAAKALGQIASLEAAEALAKALDAAGQDLKDIVAASLLQCAEEYLAAKSHQASFQIYDRLSKENVSSALRRAALRGKILSADDQAQELILETLSAPDQEMHASAIGLIKNFFDGKDISELCKVFPTLQESSQIQVLAVLSDYPKDYVLGTIAQAAKSPEREIRIAAIKALEKTGDETTVEFLAETAAKSRGKEQDAARTSLWGLKGRAADNAILALLEKQPGEDIQAEFVRAVGERRIFPAKTQVMKCTDSPSPKVRASALRAIKDIGTPSDIPGLLDLLYKTEDEQEKYGIENAIVGLAQKISRPTSRANAVKARLDPENPEKDAKKRCVLYRVLGRIGDDSSLTLLRNALDDPNAEIVDAAVRALVNWPTATAGGDVFDIAKSSKNETHRVLALRAYIRMTGLEKYRSPKAAVKDLKKALKLASRPEEKKLILGVLPDFACPDALKLAATLLDDVGVESEAEVAIEKITEELKKQQAGRDRQ